MKIKQIIEDFKNQVALHKRKSCPLTNMRCDKNCYNYVPPRLRLTIESGGTTYPASRIIVESDLNILMEKYKKAGNPKILQVTSYMECCNFFDAIASLEQ
jgi:hypothetical protein